MSSHLTCAHGHEWEIVAADAHTCGAAQGQCPICGSAPLASPIVADATTLQPGEMVCVQTNDGRTVAVGRQTQHGHHPLPEEPAGSARLPTIAGYDILGELGRGGMGVVYKARHLKLNRLVALKMILTGGHARADDLVRFRSEAEAVAGLYHPNIVQIFDIGEQNGLPYFSLEFVAGGALERQLDGTPWAAPDVARLMETLARAMHAAHERGVVHRDLKPANVLLTPQGSPKITDFGLAKRLDADTGQTRTGTIIGTPSYMAPEQASGHVHAIGPTTDVYALGAMLYELLTGRPPFKAPTPLDTIMQVVHGEPVPPVQLNARVPRDLETICLKCLQKDAVKRYPSAAELADDLQRFQKREPIRARPVGRLEKLARWCRRNPVVASLLTLVALLLVAGTIVSTYFGIEAERGARQARRRLYIADLRLVQQAWEHNQLDRVRELLRGQHPAETGGLDLRGFEWHYWNRQLRVSRAAPDGHEWAINSIALSPDGQRIATAGWDQIVNIWDAQTGRVLFALTGHADTIHTVAFSADGRRIASAGADRTVRLWDAATGAALGTFKGHTATVRAVAFDPDGKHLVSGGEDRVDAIRIWDVTSGRLEGTFAHAGGVLSLAFSRNGEWLASGGKHDGAVQIWDVRGRRQKTPVKSAHKLGVSSVAFNPDGTRLASASWDGTVNVSDTANGRPVIKPLQHPPLVFAVAWSPDGQQLATAGREHGVRLWEANTGRQLRAFNDTGGAVRGVVFCPGGQQVAAAGDDRTARLWNIADGQLLRRFSRTTDAVTLSLDHKLLDRHARNPFVRVWDPGGRQETLTFQGHSTTDNTAVMAVAFSPDGKRIASVDWINSVYLWDPDAVERPQQIDHHGEVARCVAFSPDGDVLFLGDSHGVAIVTPSGPVGQFPRLGEHPDPVRALAVSTETRRLATACEDGNVRIWDIDSHDLVATLDRHTGMVLAVAFAPGGMVASAGEDQVIRLHAAPTGELQQTILAHGSTITCLAFSRDGRHLASGSADKTVCIWDAATGALEHTLKGHSLAVNALAFSPDGRRLASASEDWTIKVWNARGGQEVLTLRGHTQGVTGVAFSPDGQRLVSSSKDGTVKVWDARPVGDEP